MSCNGCRVLRKGCSDNCVLRQCLRWIESPDAQGHATVFVAKFFGRAGMMSLVSSVPESQRPALFQSLLHEACGRTINPIFGAVGLLCSGNWKLCQEAVETVMRGDMLCPTSSGTGRPGMKFPNKIRLGRGYINSPSYMVNSPSTDDGLKRRRTYESSEYDSKKACVEERVRLDLTLGCPRTHSTTTRLSSPCHSSDSNTTDLSISGRTENSSVKQELLDLLH